MTNIIARLRELAPSVSVSIDESLAVAEQQAALLLSLSGVNEPPVPERIIIDLPRVEVRVVPLKHSGETHWINGLWKVRLDASETWMRRRWTLMHEFKHVVDHPLTSVAERRLGPDLAARRAEQLADAFAAAALAPSVWVRQAWDEGAQDARLLARIFAVSPSAMRVRLEHLDLAPRHARHPMRGAA